MNKDVCIDIKSTQYANDDMDTTELFTYGMFKSNEKGQKYTISYTESEATGFDGCEVILDVEGDNIVTLNRKGDSTANLVIERGKKHHCHYGTPYGDFIVGISTDDIKSNLSKNGGELYLKYTIDINSSLMSKNEMYIKVKEVAKEN